MNVLDLFSGIGGFSLGLERAGMRTVAFCEIEPYCRAVIGSQWPGIPIYGDVRQLSSQHLTADGIKPDLICGGFPCQDISLAGEGAGIEGERSGLWQDFARLIGEIRPQFVIVENVSALLGRGLGRVLGDLAERGYDAEWDCFPTGLNFGHSRERIWIVAHDVQQRLEKRRDTDQVDADEARIFTRERFACLFESVDPRQKWKDRPLLGRGIHGLPGRVDRVAALGNSLNPKVPEIIGRAIMELNS